MAAAALSHLYLGAEGALLLALVSAYGTFASPVAYAFFTTSGWLFTASLLLGALLFNPFALDVRTVLGDCRSWAHWLAAAPPPPPPAAAPPPAADAAASASWVAWHEREVGRQYASASLPARAWRALRISRLLLLAALMLQRLPAAAASPRFLGIYIGLAAGALALMQVVHVTFLPCGAGAAGGGLRSATQAVVALIFACAAVAATALTSGGALEAHDAALSSTTFAVLLWWAKCIVDIARVQPLAAGARAVHRIADALIGAALLAVQLAAAVACPGAAHLHTRMLFSRRYADAVGVAAGSKALLDAHAKDAAARFLKLKAVDLGDLQHATAAAAGGDAPPPPPPPPLPHGAPPPGGAAAGAAAAAAEPVDEFGLPASVAPQAIIGTLRARRLRRLSEIDDAVEMMRAAPSPPAAGADAAAAGAGTGLDGAAQPPRAATLGEILASYPDAAPVAATAGPPRRGGTQPQPPQQPPQAAPVRAPGASRAFAFWRG